MSRSIKDSIRD